MAKVIDYEKKWQVEADLDALCRAKAVKADPERMKACKKLAKERLSESKRKKEEAETAIEMAMD